MDGVRITGQHIIFVLLNLFTAFILLMNWKLSLKEGKGVSQVHICRKDKATLNNWKPMIACLLEEGENTDEEIGRILRAKNEDLTNLLNKDNRFSEV